MALVRAYRCNVLHLLTFPLPLCNISVRLFMVVLKPRWSFSMLWSPHCRLVAFLLWLQNPDYVFSCEHRHRIATTRTIVSINNSYSVLSCGPQRSDGTVTAAVRNFHHWNSKGTTPFFTWTHYNRPTLRPVSLSPIRKGKVRRAPATLANFGLKFC